MAKLEGTTVVRLAAEFMVIVVGVLVALGAEAAWSARQDRAFEAETLQRIRADLDGDSQLIADLQGWVGLGAPAARRVPAIIDSDRPMTPSDLSTIYAAALIYTQDRSFSTWDDLVASGRTGVISDPTAREALNEYYGEFADVSALKESIGAEYRAAILSTLPVEYTRAILAECLRDPEDSTRPHPDGFAGVLSCPVEPLGGAAALGRELRALPGLAGAARLRDYAFGTVGEAINRTIRVRDDAIVAVNRALSEYGSDADAIDPGGEAAR